MGNIAEGSSRKEVIINLYTCSCSNVSKSNNAFSKSRVKRTDEVVDLGSWKALSTSIHLWFKNEWSSLLSAEWQDAEKQVMSYIGCFLPPNGKKLVSTIEAYYTHCWPRQLMPVMKSSMSFSSADWVHPKLRAVNFIHLNGKVRATRKQLCRCKLEST